MSNYFGVHHTPSEEFGNQLFDDWDSNEWERFDKFMINCLQYYLTNGLVSSKTNNLALRKFINETSHEFYEFSCIDKQIQKGVRLIKSDFLNNYIAEHPDSKKWITLRSLMRWVKKYCDFVGEKYTDGNTNGQRWFQVGEVSCTDEKTEEKTPF